MCKMFTEFNYIHYPSNNIFIHSIYHWILDKFYQKKNKHTIFTESLPQTLQYSCV